MCMFILSKKINYYTCKLLSSPSNFFDCGPGTDVLTFGAHGSFCKENAEVDKFRKSATLKQNNFGIL